MQTAADPKEVAVEDTLKPSTLEEVADEAVEVESNRSPETEGFNNWNDVPINFVAGPEVSPNPL